MCTGVWRRTKTGVHVGHLQRWQPYTQQLASTIPCSTIATSPLIILLGHAKIPNEWRDIFNIGHIFWPLDTCAGDDAGCVV